MIDDAMLSMRAAQVLNVATRAVHAAGFWTPERQPVALRENVGRHNALDKLLGALTRSDMLAGSDMSAGPGVAGGGVKAGGCVTRAADGLVLLSSRVSVEMGAEGGDAGRAGDRCDLGADVTCHRVADGAGITLIGVARDDGFEVFTHHHPDHTPYYMTSWLIWHTRNGVSSCRRHSHRCRGDRGSQAWVLEFASARAIVARLADGSIQLDRLYAAGG
jgi:hypothetical protein